MICNLHKILKYFHSLREWPFLLGFLCLNSSGVGIPHSKQMPGHYIASSHTLRIHGLQNRELAVFMASL